ncbi:outer membrane lipoprotein-sorting protein [Oligoflexaceae bacterium]|nr:outer membrane lipoprotein-sorting protein [Oligoflexaceae bacterium]
MKILWIILALAPSLLFAAEAVPTKEAVPEKKAVSKKEAAPKKGAAVKKSNSKITADADESNNDDDDGKEVLDSTKKYTEKQASEIVTKAEKIRAVSNAETEVSLRTIARKVDSDYVMIVKRGLGKRALVEFIAPPEENGRRLLIVKNKYWAKFPDSRKIHPISRREMLGNSVFGVVDLFQLDVVHEYKASIAGETKTRGHDCYKAVLDARHDEVVYKKVEYYISKKDFYPIKARFYADSGRLLKTLFLTGRKKLAGKTRPHAFTMVDNITKGRKSFWKTLKMKNEEIPNHIFRRSHLRKRN